MIAESPPKQARLACQGRASPGVAPCSRWPCVPLVDITHRGWPCASKPGPIIHCKETAGAFLVRLKITVADGSADFHYVAFDAARALIIDNAPYVKFPEIGAEDLRDNLSAIRPFYHLFPNATDIRIVSVLKGVVAA